MSRIFCDTCGQSYPESWQSVTCKLCGGLIFEREQPHHPKLYRLQRQWHEWREWLLSYPAVTMTEPLWLETVKHFNSCAICGNESVEERLFFIPPVHGGKYWVHNVLPACTRCASIIRANQAINPLQPYFDRGDIDAKRVEKAMEFLRPKEIFNPSSVEITCRLTQDTHGYFEGVTARHVFNESYGLKKHNRGCTYDEQEGITWMLK